MVEKTQCPHCNGTGEIEFTGVYAETLKTMRKVCISDVAGADYIVANRHSHLFGCQPTALNNRLRRLEELGFVRGERFGREHRYYLVPFK